MKKNICQHPKSKIAKYTDNKTNTYYEKCIKCSKNIYVRKFPKETIKND